MPHDLEAPLEQWARRGRPHFDRIVSVPPSDLSGATLGLAEPSRSWLASDLAALLALLAEVSGARRVRVSFGAVRTDQCPKFHMDYVAYRLVTTYLGPGTEWVPEHAVDRAALDHPNDCPCDANKNIVPDLGLVRHAEVGEVLLMKGALHSNGRGAVHRSPSIEGTGRVRVVLAASPVHDA